MANRGLNLRVSSFNVACQQRTLRLGNAKMGRTRCDRAAMMGTITNPVGPTMKSKLRSRGAFLLYASQQKHVD